MEMRGIDPRAPRMQSECSTIWATPPTVQNKRKRETSEINLEKKQKTLQRGFEPRSFTWQAKILTNYTIEDFWKEGKATHKRQTDRKKRENTDDRERKKSNIR